MRLDQFQEKFHHLLIASGYNKPPKFELLQNYLSELPIIFSMHSYQFCEAIHINRKNYLNPIQRFHGEYDIEKLRYEMENATPDHLFCIILRNKRNRWEHGVIYYQGIKEVSPWRHQIELSQHTPD